MLPADRAKYTVQMPPFAAAMNDADLAETLTFVRRAFGKGATAITPAQVAAQRQTMRGREEIVGYREARPIAAPSPYAASSHAVPGAVGWPTASAALAA